MSELERNADVNAIKQATKFQLLFSKNNARNDNEIEAPHDFILQEMSSSGFVQSPRVPEMATQTPSQKHARSRYGAKEVSASLRDSGAIRNGQSKNNQNFKQRRVMPLAINSTQDIPYGQ